MVNQKVTPEERLLRLIETDGKGGVEEHVTQKRPIWDVRSWPKIFSRRHNGAFRSWFPFGGNRPEFNLGWVNRILVVLLILAVIGVAFNLNSSPTLPTDLRGQPQLSGGGTGTEGGGQMELASINPLPEYLKEVAQRNIFAPMPAPALKPQRPELKPIKPVKPPPSDPSRILQEKVKSLKLVGIAWGETPVAMIEDKTSQQTSFLKEGDSINDLQVKTILRDRAILSHGDAEYDLF